jgi:hypothetical protein
MTFRAVAKKTAILLVMLIATAGVVAPATSAKASKPPVQWIDLSGTASQRPKLIFFSANSGSQVNSIKWTGWGKNRAIGRGTYLVTSPPPPGEENPTGPARVVVWKPISCVPDFGNREGKRIRVYRHARMLRPVREGGRKWVDISAFTGYLTCR